MAFFTTIHHLGEPQAIFSPLAFNRGSFAGPMPFFSIPRIQAAIEHLSHYETKWVLVPWVLAMNGVGAQDVNTGAQNLPGTGRLIRRFFNGELIGLPAFDNGNNLIRPRFREVEPDAGDDFIVHQRNELWANVFSRNGYKEMRDKGLLGGEGSIFRVNQGFQNELAQHLNGFHYEELLVWLFGLRPDGFAAGNWADLDGELRGNLADGRAYPNEYLPLFAPDAGGAVPWPQNDIVQQRPTNEEFRAALFPSYNAHPLPVQVAPPPAALPQAGRNVIISGAPGVGKSFYVEQRFPDEGHRIRTVFHPEYGYADFVGSYQPVQIAAAAGEDQRFTYAFVPGPFTRALVGAMNEPAAAWVLVIEEISRAPAAAVFGDVFQLLDRRPTGESEYTITPAERLAAYIEAHVAGWNRAQGLRIPANLHIYATMNPADQGVQRLDSAFKRRWSWRYLRLDFAHCAYRDMQVNYGGIECTWRELCGALNGVLKARANIPEDRLIGPFFLRQRELAEAEEFLGKLLHYLWDDVLRHQNKDILFVAENGATFSDVAERFGGGQGIFSQAVHDELGAIRAPVVAA